MQTNPVPFRRIRWLAPGPGGTLLGGGPDGVRLDLARSELLVADGFEDLVEPPVFVGDELMVARRWNGVALERFPAGDAVDQLAEGEDLQVVASPDGARVAVREGLRLRVYRLPGPRRGPR